MDWVYLAAFYDFDGWAGILQRKNHITPRIGFSSTDGEVVELARLFLNNHGIGLNVKVAVRDQNDPGRKGKPWKDCHIFVMGGAMDCLRTAENLVEFSLIDRKRVTLEKLIDAVKLMPGMIWKTREPEMRRLYWEEGYTQGDLAKHYGASRENIGYHMRELGIPRRSRRVRKRDEYGRYVRARAEQAIKRD